MSFKVIYFFCLNNKQIHGTMSDTSNYTTEQRTVVSVWTHERPQTGEDNEPGA